MVSVVSDLVILARKQRYLLSENLRLNNFKTGCNLLKKNLDHLKIEFIETEKECDLLKVIQQFAPKDLAYFPFYHIVSFRHISSHSENLFLVAEVLDEDTSSYCKYKLNYVSAFILLDGFTMRIL